MKYEYFFLEMQHFKNHSSVLHSWLYKCVDHSKGLEALTPISR